PRTWGPRQEVAPPLWRQNHECAHDRNARWPAGPCRRGGTTGDPGAVSAEREGPELSCGGSWGRRHFDGTVPHLLRQATRPAGGVGGVGAADTGERNPGVLSQAAARHGPLACRAAG